MSLTFKIVTILFLFEKSYSVTLFSERAGFNFSSDEIFYHKEKIRPAANTRPPPDNIDWRTEDGGHVSPVKDQERCNACWAFGIIASIESHRSIYVDTKDVLSEQFLIDCNPDNYGCQPASIVGTFSQIMSIGGVLREVDYYKYSGRKERCRYNFDRPPVPVMGFRRVPSLDEYKMAEAVYSQGPIVAAINDAAMNKYRRGHAIDEPTERECPSDKDSLNHVVLIVGYSSTTDDNNRSVPYWIIKNSWGKDWGDNGFYYLVRGRNACGIANDVSFPYVT